jgi:CDP-2,3-bis-(O-geranylgeranyl)-sn-glycerol synthase
MVRVNFATDLKLLVLISLANGVPIVAKNIFGNGLPLDGGASLGDGRALFGPSKTVRGLVLALLATAVAAPFLGIEWKIGLLIGAAAMAGDLLSSFAKRRAGAPVSSMALGIDQIPESLFPALACMSRLGLSLADIGAICIVFFIAELAISRVLYRLKLRDRPY